MGPAVTTLCQFSCFSCCVHLSLLCPPPTSAAGMLESAGIVWAGSLLVESVAVTTRGCATSCVFLPRGLSFLAGPGLVLKRVFVVGGLPSACPSTCPRSHINAWKSNLPINHLPRHAWHFCSQPPEFFVVVAPYKSPVASLHVHDAYLVCHYGGCLGWEFLHICGCVCGEKAQPLIEIAWWLGFGRGEG